MIESAANFTNGKYNISISTDNKDYFIEINKVIERLIEKEDDKELEDGEIVSLPLKVFQGNYSITIDDIKNYISTNEDFLYKAKNNMIYIHMSPPTSFINPIETSFIDPMKVVGIFIGSVSVGDELFITFKISNTFAGNEFKTMKKLNNSKCYLVPRGFVNATWEKENNPSEIEKMVIHSFVLKVKEE